MQLLNTPDLKAVSWTPPASSADIHFKENLDGEIDSAGAVTHQDVAAISGLAAEFVSLAESVLTLAGSEKTRQPDQDGDGKASLSLAKLRELKTDAERTLERSAMMLGGAVAEPSKKLNLVDGALEMRLVFLSVELSTVIDETLKGRFQAQKDRNTEIQNLNELMDELRKLQKSKENFTAADLEKAFKSFPPDSPILRAGVERLRKAGDAAAAEAENAECRKVIVVGPSGIASVAMPGVYYYVNPIPDFFSADAEGNLLMWKKNDDGSLHYIGSYYVPGFYGLSGNPVEKLRAAFVHRAEADSACEKKCNEYLANGKANLGDMLYAYGVYKDGEKLPTTKEELEAATEKISSMVSSINSTQSLKMLDINKFTSGRNEAFSLAVKVNNGKVDNLNAIIRQIGERQ